MKYFIGFLALAITAVLWACARASGKADRESEKVKFDREQSSPSQCSILDERLFKCDHCRIMFGIPKYLTEYQVRCCPQCAYPLKSSTTLRKEYFE